MLDKTFDSLAKAVGTRPSRRISDPSKQYVGLIQGASICDSSMSFAMMRGGHLDLTVLGAFQVSSKGDLANWQTDDADAIPGVGGALDLAIGAKRVFGHDGARDQEQ